MKKRYAFPVLILSIVWMLSALLTSCGDEQTDMSYRHRYCELALNLPQSYAELTSDSFDAFFSTGEAFVGISRLTFQGLEGDDLDGSMFPDEVARRYAQKNSMDVAVVDAEGYSYFIYFEGGYYNLISFYRSKYAHFIVRFMCSEEKEVKYSADFLKYASEAKFIQ